MRVSAHITAGALTIGNTGSRFTAPDTAARFIAAHAKRTILISNTPLRFAGTYRSVADLSNPAVDIVRAHGHAPVAVAAVVCRAIRHTGTYVRYAPAALNMTG